MSDLYSSMRIEASRGPLGLEALELAVRVRPSMRRDKPGAMSESLRPLALVGMSGVGKSHWARRLERRGFARLDIDSRIAERLGELVPAELRAEAAAEGREPVHALGVWMGMPWTSGHALREATYLALEEAVTNDALAEAEQLIRAGRSVVIDCTGSVVYLAPSTLEELAALAHVVYLRTPDERRGAMLARYVEEPKPVVWGGAFHVAGNERPEDALVRCYPALLAARDARYAALAHDVIDGAELERATEPEGVARLCRMSATDADGA